MPVNSILTNASITHRKGIQFDTNFVRRDNIKEGITAFFNGTCPRGWVQYTTAAGRNIRFASSSIESTGGNDGHSHTFTTTQFSGLKVITGSGSKPNYIGASNGATVSTSGESTTAPKIKYMFCKKVSAV